jgi:hypothetical protein
MLTDSPSPSTLFFHFTLYNQSVAFAVSAGILWHVSCDVPYEQIMSTVVLSAKVE